MNYVKQNFYTGQTLTAEHLRHIEDGIEVNAREINALTDPTSEFEQLFDDTKTVSEVYIDADGVEIAVDGVDTHTWHITDYMPVGTSNIYYYTNLNAVGSAPHSAFYDSDKNLYLINFSINLFNN